MATNDHIKILANTLAKAAKIHEESFDHEAADRVKEEEKYTLDYYKFYTISLQEACDMAAEETGFGIRGTQPLYLLLQCCWNDTLEWVNKVLS